MRLKEISLRLNEFSQKNFKDRTKEKQCSLFFKLNQKRYRTSSTYATLTTYLCTNITNNCCQRLINGFDAVHSVTNFTFTPKSHLYKPFLRQHGEASTVSWEHFGEYLYWGRLFLGGTCSLNNGAGGAIIARTVTTAAIASSKA